MVNGGAPWNNTLTITKSKITKKYKKNALIPFMRELYVYLLAKQKKLNYIPKLLNYDIEKKILVIENVGISIYDLCKKTKCNKDDFLPGIKEIYHKLIDLGIYHNDIHDENFLYKNNKIFLVDFGRATENKEAFPFLNVSSSCLDDCDSFFHVFLHAEKNFKKIHRV